MDKIGICGIPSLWMSKDELCSKGHLFRHQIEEQERLELILRILHSHKKYENDKYYGGSIFKRGNQAQNQGGSGNSNNNTIGTYQIGSVNG